MEKVKEARAQMQLIWPGLSKTRRASLSTQMINGRLEKAWAHCSTRWGTWYHSYGKGWDDECLLQLSIYYQDQLSGIPDTRDQEVRLEQGRCTLGGRGSGLRITKQTYWNPWPLLGCISWDAPTPKCGGSWQMSL